MSRLDLKHAFVGFLLLCAGNVSIDAATSSEVSSDNANLAQLHALEASDAYEQTVLVILDAIKQGNLNQALVHADAHLSAFPKSRIGYLLRADILAAMTGNVATDRLQASVPSETHKGLLHQLKNRWQHGRSLQDHEHRKWPSSLLLMGENSHALVADLAAGRLYVYKNTADQPLLIRDYYLTMGSQGFGKQVEGDNKTPIGIYRVNRHIEGKALPDLYGKGAFPVDYPNKYDRFLGRTGYGIWLHGTPSDTYARAPWSSEGCFVLSNDDLLDVASFIDVKKRTPVLLTDGINWVDAEGLSERRNALLAAVAQWERDWESLDTDAFLAHYATENFNFGKQSFTQWAARKRQVNKAKSYINVTLRVTSLFEYPGENDMFVVTFQQDYDSSNFSNSSNKQQYWQRQADGVWKIIYEGKV